MTFALDYKSNPGYLDQAANSHGEEKSLLAWHALQRIDSSRPHLVEIGPGGGAAIGHLATRLQHVCDGVDVTLVEMPGVTSESLSEAMAAFGATCRLVEGTAQYLDRVLDGEADVVTASALLHEVYSYGRGYGDIHGIMRMLPSVIREGGFFGYRDVYAVEGESLHRRVTHVYDTGVWVRFLSLFMPHYLRLGTHPYHHAEDEVVARQNSRIVPVDQLDPTACTVVAAPIGLHREVQRHYITFRDHVWRSGALGFAPILEGQLTHDWLDARTGHKRVHFRLTTCDWLPPSRKAMLLAVSEPYGDHYVVDGDVFDDCTDVAIAMLLTAVQRRAKECARVWQEWSAREGRETYAYLTLDELITSVAVHSAEGGQGAVLLPARVGDVRLHTRDYYNRYLSRRLPTPLTDAKQLVLFQRIALSDACGLADAMETVRPFCNKRNLARIYTAITAKE